MTDLIEDYFANYETVRKEVSWWEMTESDRERHVRVFEGVDRLAFDDPERLWPILLQLIDQAPDSEALALVAAGPLEEVVRSHAMHFQHRLIEESRRSPRFREAVLGIWGWEEVPNEVRRRLEAEVGPLSVRELEPGTDATPTKRIRRR